MGFNDISKKIFFSLKNNIKKQYKYNRSEVNYIQMNNIIKSKDKVVLLDVRSIQEYNEGHLNGAINIPLSELKIKAKVLLNIDDIIITYCQVGERSKKAVNILKKLGYKNVYTLEGGLDAMNL